MPVAGRYIYVARLGDFAFDGTKNNEYIGHDEEHLYGCLMLVRSK